VFPLFNHIYRPQPSKCVNIMFSFYVCSLSHIASRETSHLSMIDAYIHTTPI
jgi:hypothetical protein